MILDEKLEKYVGKGSCEATAAHLKTTEEENLRSFLYHNMNLLTFQGNIAEI